MRHILPQDQPLTMSANLSQPKRAANTTAALYHPVTLITSALAVARTPEVLKTSLRK